jgi:hypothetical protein
MKVIRFATTRVGNKVVHLVPAGNRHARCGVVAVNVIHDAKAGEGIFSGANSACKNCLRVAAPRDLTPDLGYLTDTWEVANGAGTKLVRVYGHDLAQAREKAMRHAVVRNTYRIEDGFAIRRLHSKEL